MARKKRRTQPTRPPAAPGEQPELSAEERAVRREEQKREWAQQKRAEERAASRSFAPLLAAGGVIVTLAIVIPVVLLVATGGGSDSASATPIVTPDARVAGEVPVATFAVSADDDGQNINPRFSPNNFVAKAGEVFEIDVKNDGSVFHNLVVDGGDGDFGTRDDFISNPSRIEAAGSAKVLAKLVKAGTYNFRCDFHPDAQTGTITVIPSAGTAITPVPTSTVQPSP